MNKLIKIFALLAACSPLANAYQISAIRSVGAVTIGLDMVHENQTYQSNLPIYVVTHDKSSVSAVLPLDCGIFLSDNAAMIVSDISIYKVGKNGSRALNCMWIELTRGDFAMCLPDETVAETRIELQVRDVHIIVYSGTTFAILNDTIYVIRGKVRIGALTMTDRQITRVSNDGKLATPADFNDLVMEAATDACLARLTTPEGIARPTGDTESTGVDFPKQPINPEIVSPAS